MSTTAITLQRGGRELGVSLAPHLDEWVSTRPLVVALHSGDVGWHLRFDDAALADAFWLWRAGRIPVAIGMTDAGVLRTALAPRWTESTALATALVGELDGIQYVDAPAGSALRTGLLLDGWSANPDPWVLLYKELTLADAEHEDVGTRTLSGEADVLARVAVQRSAFAPGSTFQPELWARMAAGPSFDRRFELLTRTPEGEPAAAATAWFAGPGRCAILEPVGTHAAHRRRGYGRRVTLAAVAALARAGASGVRVHTPVSNAAAVATYEACGLRQVEWTTDVAPPPL